MRMVATAELGTYLIESQTKRGVEWIMKGVGTPFLVCSCPAASMNHGECKHTIAVLEQMIEEMKMVVDTERIEIAEQTVTSGKELMVSKTNGSLVRADQYERGLMLRGTAAALAGAFAELLPLARAMVDANLTPAGMNIPAAALVMQRALELGMPPMTAFELLYVVDGKVKMQGQGVQALIQRDGRGRIEIDPESNNTWCRAVGSRPGYKDLEITWTIEMAREAKLTSKFGWQSYPADMLRWKCIARIGRLLFADLLGGMDVVDPTGQAFDSVVLENSAVAQIEVPDTYSVTTEKTEQPKTEPKGDKSWLPDWVALVKARGLTKDMLCEYFGSERVTPTHVQKCLDDGMALADVATDAQVAWAANHPSSDPAPSSDDSQSEPNTPETAPEAAKAEPEVEEPELPFD